MVSTADMPPIASYDEKTVSLHRGHRGFGFVLRGAKGSSPGLKQAAQQLENQPQPISLQYLDEVEPHGVAECAGLRKGDFLTNVNGVDVRSAPHELVVQLIRQSGDKVTMTVATPIYLDSENGYATHNQEKRELSSSFSGGSRPMRKDFAATLPRGSTSSSMSSESRESRSQSKNRAPPAPPKRDPSTTLSIGRARARSLCVSGALESGGDDITSTNEDNNRNSTGQIGSTSNESASPSQTNGSGGGGNTTRHSASGDLIMSNSNGNSNNSLQKAQVRGTSSNDDSGNKVASIRSRNFHRISAVELNKYFTSANGKDSNVSVHFADDDPRSKADMKSGEKSNYANTLQSLKKRLLKKKKEFSSTPDIQEQLIAEQCQNEYRMMINLGSASPKLDKNGNLLATSQEDLNQSLIRSPAVISETLTLKNGKIVSSSIPNSSTIDDVHTSSVHDTEGDGPAAGGRSAPPTHPPPPPPTNMSVPTSRSVVIKVDVRHKHAKSDYANFSLIKGKQEINCADKQQSASASLSSFKPPVPLPSESGEIEDEVNSSNHKKANYNAIDTMNQRNQAVANATSTRGANSNNNNNNSTSEETNGILEGKKPFIPDPDYSSEDDALNGANSGSRNLKTFKSLPSSAVPCADDKTQQASPTIGAINVRMAQSYHETGNQMKENEKSNIPTSASEFEALASSARDSKNSEFEAQLKSKVQNFAANSASKSAALSKLVERSDDKVKSSSYNNDDNTNESAIDRSSCDDPSKSRSEHLNKVKESILEFERRYSINSDGITTKVTSKAGNKDAISNNSSNNNNNSSNNGANKVPESSDPNQSSSALRMSKSCFEVDICDSSSGVSSDFDCEGSTVHHHHHHHHHQTISNQTNNNNNNNNNDAGNIRFQQIRSLNRRNSNIVSEKIATLMAHNTSSPRSTSDSASNTLKASSLHHHHQDEVQGANNRDAGNISVVGGHQRRSSIDVVSLERERNSLPNSVRITVNSSTPPSIDPIVSDVTYSSTIGSSHSKAAPTTAKTWSEISSAIRAAKGGVAGVVSSVATPVQYSGQQMALMRTMASTNRPTSAPIMKKKHSEDHSQQHQQQQRLVCIPVDSSGLTAVTEVDVMAELVPPPPEFAAPPPHSIESSRMVVNRQPVTSSMMTNAANDGQIRSRSAMQHPAHHHQALTSSMYKKEDIRVINTATGQKIHIVHKPTPHQQPLQTCYHTALANQAHQLVRKTNTPPPPPPPEFSDLSAAARHGISGAIYQTQPQHSSGQNFSQPKIQYAIYPENTRQYQSYLQQPNQQQQFATITRYAVKQQQGQSVPRQRYSSSDQIQMSRSLGSDSPAMFACAGIVDPYRQHQQDNRYAYQQYATLSRGRADQLNAQYSTDYSRLTVQNRLMRQQQMHSGHSHQYYTSDAHKQQQIASSPHQLGHSHSHSHSHQHQHQLAVAAPSSSAASGQGTMVSSSSPSTMSHPLQPTKPPPPGPPPSLQQQQQQQQQHQQHQHQHQQKVPATFPKRSMVDWSEEDVKDWISSIGMVEHRNRFEYVNGPKLLRLDNNDLIGIGVKPSQHRSFILEKIKQHLYYQQQHPPVP